VATSSRPYQNEYRRNARSSDAFKRPKSMTRSQVLEGERKEKMKRWITFFRRNPHRFIKDYFGITLYPYQILMIWVLQRSNMAYIVASRAAAKTFIIAVWAMTLAVLYPGMKVKTCSRTLKQGGLIIKKIEELMQDYPNVAREIHKTTSNQNNYLCEFRCGSTIEAVPSSESARGNRCSYLIIEESRIVSKEILEQIIKPFLSVRQPPYLNKEKFRQDKFLIEEPSTSYITSAGYKAESWFEYVTNCIRKMVSGDTSYNFLAFDYLITIYHRIKTEKTIKDEMEDNDTLTNQLEYYNIPSGSSGQSYFKPTLFERKTKRAFYPQKDDNYNAKRNPYGIPKVSGEIRIVSADIATRANKANDQTIMGCIRILPSRKGYVRYLTYMESHKGKNTLLQSKRLKEVFYDFEADYLVLDLMNAGISVFDALTQATPSDERGITFPAWTIVGEQFEFIDSKVRDDMNQRTLGIEAERVVFPILASKVLNSQIAVAFRTSLQKKLWHYLLSEGEAENFLIKKNKEFMADATDSSAYNFFMNPYIQTSLFIGECINLDLSQLDGLIKLERKVGNYKDRYSCISYGNWVISQLEKDLLREEGDYDEDREVLDLTLVV